MAVTTVHSVSLLPPRRLDNLLERSWYRFCSDRSCHQCRSCIPPVRYIMAALHRYKGSGGFHTLAMQGPVEGVPGSISRDDVWVGVIIIGLEALPGLLPFVAQTAARMGIVDVSHLIGAWPPILIQRRDVEPVLVIVQRSGLLLRQVQVGVLPVHHGDHLPIRYHRGIGCGVVRPVTMAQQVVDLPVERNSRGLYRYTGG